MAATNKDVDNVNDIVSRSLPGEEKIYLSVDTPTGNGHEDIGILVEVLNNYNHLSLPLHSLRVKGDQIILLLRNLNVVEGLCNGTRLEVKHISQCVDLQSFG